MKRITLFSMSLMISVMASGQPFMRLDASFYSPSLDLVKPVDIYLPGEYYLSLETEFPVIYYLHGAGGDQNESSTFAYLYYGQHYNDTTLDSPAAIIVAPDGSCEPYRGSMWMNSECYGNYEDYFILDLIPFIDSNFRTSDAREFRFITGVSMGGFGSACQALKHPGLFRASAPIAGCLSFPDTMLNRWRDKLYEENEGFYFSYGAGTWTDLYFTISAGGCCNEEAEPYHFESLIDTLGNIVDSVRTLWNEYSSCRMVQDLSPSDRLSFLLECGSADQFIFYPTYLELEDSLAKYGIDYRTAYHDQGHIIEPVTTRKLCHWLDSLIAEGYTHLGMVEGECLTPFNDFRVYPNPFTGMASLALKLDRPAQLKISLLDQLGRNAGTLFSGNRPSGIHQLRLDASFANPGLYYIRLWINGKVAPKTVKVMIM